MPKPLAVRKRRAQHTAYSQKTKQRLKTLQAFGLLIAVVFVLFAFQQLARVQTISCQFHTNHTAPTPCDDTINAKLHSLSGTPLIFYDHTRAVATALTTEPVLIDSVEKYFPRTLHVKLTREQLVYAVEHNGVRYGVTESGNYFATSDGVGLHTITSEQLSVEEILAHHETIQQIIAVAQTQPASFTTMHWSDPNQIILRLPDSDIKPVIHLSDWRKDLHMANTILTSPEFESYQDQDYYLDARFNLPVLRETL